MLKLCAKPAAFPFNKKQPVQNRNIATGTLPIHQDHPCCAPCAGCPGLGNTGTVSSWSSPMPPIVPCVVFCHPCPVCWFTKALCRKGFVLPVGLAIKPLCGEGVCCCGEPCRAKGFVPIEADCIDCKPCCCCCWGCGANGEVGWGVRTEGVVVKGEDDMLED
jgi:hypothetical protein